VDPRITEDDWLDNAVGDVRIFGPSSDFTVDISTSYFWILLNGRRRRVSGIVKTTKTSEITKLVLG